MCKQIDFQDRIVSWEKFLYFNAHLEDKMFSRFPSGSQYIVYFHVCNGVETPWLLVATRDILESSKKMRY